MTKLPFVFVTTALAVVLIAASVQAQPPARQKGGRRGGQAGGPMMTFMLLRNEKVQEDLALTDKQKEDLTSLAGDLQGLRDATPEERQTKIQGIEKQIGTILKPEQVKRLKEIRIQRGGVMAAANDPAVAKELGITPEQKEKLTAIGASVREKIMALDQSERREKMPELQKDANKQASEVLTQEQRDKLDKMGGKKIDLTP